MPPALVFGDTGDPERTAVVPDELTIIVDQTSPIAGEQSAFRDGVKITPRVDPVTTWHRAR
jgi:hypothetical protein